MKEWVEVRMYPSVAAWGWPAPLSPRGGHVSPPSGRLSLAQSILHVMRRLLSGTPRRQVGAAWGPTEGKNKEKGLKLHVWKLGLCACFLFLSFFFLLVRTPQEGSQVPWHECQCSATPGCPTSCTLSQYSWGRMFTALWPSFRSKVVRNSWTC